MPEAPGPDLGRRHSGIEALSARQKEILRLVSQHLQAKEVARLLDISERTVKTHTDAARKRLGVTSTREAARLLAAQEGPSTIVPEGRWSLRPMDGATADGAVSAHEHTPHLSAQAAAASPLRGQLAGSGNGVADAGHTGQAGPDRGDPGRPARSESVDSAGEGRLHGHRGDGLADGRRGWRQGLHAWLAARSHIEWLGLILGLALGLMILGTGLLTGAVGTMEAVQRLHRQIG